MNSELLKEIKEKGLFATTCRLQTEARAKLPQNLSGLYTPRQTIGSKLNGPGMTVGPDNRPRRIPHSDPEIHRNSRFIERPLLVTGIDADLDESEEISVDDATELLPIAVAIVAGEEDQELTDDSNLSEPELREEADEKDGEALVETGVE